MGEIASELRCELNDFFAYKSEGMHTRLAYIMPEICSIYSRLCLLLHDRAGEGAGRGGERRDRARVEHRELGEGAASCVLQVHGQTGTDAVTEKQ